MSCILDDLHWSVNVILTRNTGRDVVELTIFLNKGNGDLAENQAVSLV